MSRIETLKKQFPHLTMSLFDVLIEIDGTKTHKYSQLLCKLFDGYLQSESDRYKEELYSEVHGVLNHLSIPLDKNFNTNFMKRRILDNVRHSDIELFQTFKSYMEKGLIKETDITKYSNFTQLSAAVSLAELREFEKSSELKVHKEFEDEKWLLVRPLSFEASAKYGAGTKWCTTFKKEKEYFFKYCQNGILLYIINKESGEKFAMFYDMTIEKAETSFWDVEDKRTDITDLEIDTYLYEKIQKIKKTKRRNIDFLDSLETFQLATECSCLYRLELSKPRETILTHVPNEHARLQVPNEHARLYVTEADSLPRFQIEGHGLRELEMEPQSENELPSMRG